MLHVTLVTWKGSALVALCSGDFTTTDEIARDGGGAVIQRDTRRNGGRRRCRRLTRQRMTMIADRVDIQDQSLPDSADKEYC